jgi:hypothetical protein
MTRRFVTSMLLLVLSVSAAADVQEQTLGQVRQQVTGFLNLFSEVKCTEMVLQQKIGKKGKVEYQEQSRYDYLLITDSSDADLNLQESRLEEQASPRKKNVPLLVTNGFATLLLIFHPYYQDSFEFADLGQEMVSGRRLSKIQFRHKKGTKSPSVLVLRGREYPIELSGTAWVDPVQGNIERIRAELQASMDDVGLKVLTSDVTYLPVKFRGMKSSPWLPAEADIEVATARQHWRNLHRFTNYQHFAVSTEETPKSPAEVKATQE